MLIGEIILIGSIFIFGVVLAIFFGYDKGISSAVITVLVTLIICGCACGGFVWYHSSTASGIRSMKDQASNLSNGLEREITVTAEDGREIFHYEGKCDIETNNENYILFETEDAKRTIIYKGIQDTILIEEK